MNRRALGIVVLAGLVAVAPAIAPPAVAVNAVSSLDVAVQHATDSEFNNAQELTNVSVDGSGQSASVALNASSATTIDDFEDGDTNVETSGWDGWLKDASSGATLTAQQGTVIEGSYSGEITSNSSTNTPRWYVNPDSPTTKTLSVTLRAGTQTSTSGDYMVVQLRTQTNDGSTGTYLGALQFNDGSNVDWEGSEVLPDWSAGTDYDIEFVPEFGSDNVTIKINGTDYGSYDLFNSADDWGQIFVGSKTDSSTRNVYFDTVEAGDTTSPDEGRYTSQNVTADARTLAANVTAENASVNVSVEEWTGSQWQLVNYSNYTTTGNHTIDISTASNTKLRTNVTFRDLSGSPTNAELHDETWLFESSEPDVQNATASPSGNAKLSSGTFTAEIDISDTDFGTPQGDELNVTFFNDGGFVANQTVTSNGTVSQSITETTGGQHEWSVTVTSREYNEVVESENFTYEVPADLEIRKERSPNQLITNATVEVQFIGSSTVVEKTTSNGIVNLTGLPADEELVVNSRAPGFFNRTVVIDSLFDQQELFLLNNSAAATQAQFVIDSRVPDFNDPETLVIVERPINRSGNVEFRRLSAGETGSNGHIVQLQRDSTYRIKVRSPGGETTSLGQFDADAVTNPIRLQPGEVSFGLGGSGDVTGAFNTSLERSGSGGSKTLTLRFQYRDDREETSDLSVTIHERGNASNTLTTVQPQSGTFPLGNFSFSTTVSGANANTTWVANYSYTRAGQSVDGVKPFGAADTYGLGLPLDPGWQSILGVGLLLTLGGAFSVGNARIGALVIPGVALALWQLGFIDGVATLSGIGLAFAMAVGYNLANAGGGGVTP